MLVAALAVMTSSISASSSSADSALGSQVCRTAISDIS
jgi:hypothetical protein